METRQNQLNRTALYIPIWFYSNIISGNATEAAIKAFTFQSGSILIELANYIENNPDIFTFQSGSILILPS